MILAQTNVVEIWIYLGIIAAAAVLLGILGVWLRRRYRADSQDMNNQFGFTLDDLREMYEAGQLTEEEYKASREKLANRTKAKLLEDPDSKGGPDVVDHSDV